MTLSILIPTLTERADYLKRLNDILLPQVKEYQSEIEVRYHDAGRSMTIGQKRNELLDQSEGEYTVFIDDDDVISKDYVKYIMAAIAIRPDVVTFNGWMTTNGKNHKDFVIKLDEKYEERNGIYYRFPNHLCPMLRERVKQIRFPHIVMAEDYNYAKQIHDLKLLKSEFHIQSKIYHYDFRTFKPQYGAQ